MKCNKCGNEINLPEEVEEMKMNAYNTIEWYKAEVKLWKNKYDLLNKNYDFNIDTEFYGANLVPQVGDIILFQNGYFEVDNVIMNQQFVGKDPDYPYDVNPLNPGLQNFGWDQSVVCDCHYVPQDRVNITKARL